MRLNRTAVIAVAVVVLALVTGSEVLAADKDVIVTNTAAQPVPVTGSVTVSGGTTVSGTVNAVQSGAWSISVKPGEVLYYNPGFNVIGAAPAHIDIGPFDLSDLSKLRIVARGFNNNGGDVKFTVFVWDSEATHRTFLDEFSLNEEFVSRFYDAPPPSVLIRVTKVDGIAANYHLVVIGR
jgi:hypothetical protein